MKAEVSLARRPKSGDSRGKVRYLDLNFDGWSENGVANGEPLENGRKPHGGYKGLMKHPLGIHSFQKGADYQGHLQQVRQAQEQAQRQSPGWALQVHTLTTHSGESPLLSSRFLAASKHDSINGRLRPESSKESPRTSPRSSTPSASPNGPQRKSGGSAYYRPNRTHQYLTATELKDAADCEEVLKYGRPTRTTLLRARHRVSSACSSAYEARRQKEQRVSEIKKVAAFCSPEEMTPVYSDSAEQSFYSFLLGARYNRAHCLDSKSLTRHGVYMPRGNPLGCFVIGDTKAEHDLSARNNDSPRSETGSARAASSSSSSRPPQPGDQSQRRRPTTAPAVGRRKTSAPRASRTPRTPRSPRSGQAWGDVTVSLHVTNGASKTFTVSRDGPCKFETRLPVVHGTSLSKLQQRHFKQLLHPQQTATTSTVTNAPTNNNNNNVHHEDAPSSEALQPPPSPISARGPEGGGELCLDPHHHHPHPHAPIAPADAIQQVSDENKVLASTEQDKEDEEEEEEDEDVQNQGDRLQTLQQQGSPVTAEENAAWEKDTGEEDKDRNTEGEGGEGGEREGVEGGGGEGREGEEGGGQENAAAADGGEQATAVVEEEEEKKKEEEEEREGGGGVVVGEERKDGDAIDDTTPPDDVTPPLETPDQVAFFVTEQQATDDGGVDDDKAHDDAGDDNNNNDNDVIVSKAEADVTGGGGRQGGDVIAADDGSGTPQPEEDAASTTSSKKSQSKRVSFKIPAEQNASPDPDLIPDDDDDNNDDDDDDDNKRMEEGGDSAAVRKAGEGVEADSDAEEQGQGQGQEPLRVVVTHIEKSMGAPVSQKNEGGEEREAIAEDP
ncbi:uncharacterized protein LOC143288975 [Babylonia areolata]|uniref:uncharacterized protein LOC143288975 n=1 Tax=Babylonia areolata TaxID=304850 RepID=UPI003FCFF000